MDEENWPHDDRGWRKLTESLLGSAIKMGCSDHEAKDVTQEALIKWIRVRPTIVASLRQKPSKLDQEITEEDLCSACRYGVLRPEISKMRRRRRYTAEKPLESDPTSFVENRCRSQFRTATLPSPEDDVLYRELLQVIDASLDTKDSRAAEATVKAARKAVPLFAEDLRPREVAEVLGVEVTRINAAKRMLGQRLQKKDYVDLTAPVKRSK